MLRRTIAILAVCAGALVVGCGGDDSTAPTTSVSVPAATTTTTTSDESTAPVPPDDSAGTPSAADDPGADRPRTVEDVVGAVMTGSETPETICDQLVTPQFVKSAYGDRQGCLAGQKPGAFAKSVQVSDVQEAGDSATAVARPTGGPYDGAEVDVTLVAATDLEGAWVVDSLVADVPAGP